MSKKYIYCYNFVYHFHVCVCVSVSRSPTCGRCTRSAAGISSQLEIASANSTKISSDRADASSLPLSIFSGLLEHVVLHAAAGLQHHTAIPPMLQTGRGGTRQNYFFIRETSPARVTVGTEALYEETTCNSPGLFLVLGLVFDSVLPFTPHNPKSLHNFSFVFLRNTGLCGVMGQCVGHIMHKNPTSIFLRMLNLRLNAKRKVE